jgi:hypothetical protein
VPWGRPGTQARFGKGVVEVFVDDGGFDNDRAFVHQRGNHGVGIEFDVARLLLVARAQV